MPAENDDILGDLVDGLGLNQESIFFSLRTVLMYYRLIFGY